MLWGILPLCDKHLMCELNSSLVFTHNQSAQTDSFTAPDASGNLI